MTSTRTCSFPPGTRVSRPRGGSVLWLELPGNVDAETLFDTPRARWGGGTLTAGFAFQGTGGPKGTFDVIITESFNFDTSLTVLSGGADGSTTRSSGRRFLGRT